MTWIFWIVLFFVMAFGLVAFIGAPYVPSHKKHIKQAFVDLYPLSDKDLVVDVGSGDGIVLREASKLGARGLGLEINPFLVLISNFLSRGDKKVNFKLANYWSSRLPKDVTVVYVFSVSRDIQRIASWVQSEANRLKKEINLITYGSEPTFVAQKKTMGAYNLYIFYPLQ